LPMLAVLAFALGPWFWMLLSSIRPERDMTRTPLMIWPSTLTLAHHIELLERTSFVENLRDSLIVAAGTVMVGLGLALPAAYAFSRFRFRGRTTMRSLFLIINMFPIVMLILPLFILMRQLRLLNTYFALNSAHATFTLPFAIWLVTSYMDGIPTELDQAGLIDGATRWQAMRFVILPLVGPGMVAVGIYLFITSWNEYLFALVLAGEQVRIVTVALRMFIGENGIDLVAIDGRRNTRGTACHRIVLLLQRKLVGGLTAGAVKG
jgi:multiple sugar transport system permease protein